MKEILSENKKTLLIVLGLAISLTIMAFCVKYYSDKEEMVKLTIVKDAYSFLSTYEETDELILPIYISNEKNSFVTKENINSAAITDENEENLLKLKIENIEKCNYKVSINDEKFQCYLFKFNIVVNSNAFDYFAIDKAFLKLDYSNEVVKLNIGSFSLKKIKSYTDNNRFISITNLKGIINDIKYATIYKKDIVAIGIGIRNNTNKNIKIINIKPLDCNYQSSLKEMKFVESLPSSDEKINNILGYDYNFYEDYYYNEFNEFILQSNEKNFILLPLKKVADNFANSFGLEISFCFEDDIEKIYTIYLDDFLFFSSKNEYSEYEILTYENH